MKTSLLLRLYLPIQKIYRFIVPKKARKIIENYLFGVSKPKLRRKIIRYLNSIPKEKILSDELEVLTFLKNNPLQIFPYDFTKSFNPNRIDVFLDADKELHYVNFEGKRLYFKRSWNAERIKTIFNNLLIEQHPNSPHRYLDEKFSVDYGDVVIDIGVAEGNFALSVIEKVKKVYLFESDEEWIEALNATFAPWKDKVTIVNKWVSDVDDEAFVTMDSFFKEIKIDFVKIDVDGYESKLLNGCKRILERDQKLKIALCTYHNQDDYKIFSEFLNKEGFEISSSKGYMIFYWGEIKKPYIRKGVIRALKQNNG
jgi:hypothetical protein